MAAAWRRASSFVLILSPASNVAESMPVTSFWLAAIHFLMPMMTWGICDRYSRVETIDRMPAFCSAAVTSPGVQVTTASMQCFSFFLVLTFVSSVQNPLTYFWAASM